MNRRDFLRGSVAAVALAPIAARVALPSGPPMTATEVRFREELLVWPKLDMQDGSIFANIFSDISGLPSAPIIEWERGPVDDDLTRWGEAIARNYGLYPRSPQIPDVSTVS